MARRRHLIAYDIADPVRLRRVISIMEGYGQRLQYSVFLCDLSRAEIATWRSKMMNVVRLSEDSVVVIDLGRPGAEVLTTIGVPRTLPQTGSTII